MSTHPHELDAALDAQLRAVDLPPGLLERLQRIPLTDDRAIDDALRDVPVPRTLAARLQRVAASPWRSLALPRLAMAASILLALWLGYAGLALVLMSMPSPTPIAGPTADNAPDVAAAHPADKPGDFEASALVLAGLPHEAPARLDPAPALADPPAPGVARRPGTAADAENWLAGSTAGRPFDPLRSVTESRWGGMPAILGSSSTYDELPEFSRAASWKAAGVEQSFQSPIPPRYNVQPFWTPAAAPALASSEVPLGIDATSFEVLRVHLAAGQLPPREAIATEEIMAGLDSPLPRPQRAPLEVHISGGVSPFRPDGRVLVHVGVQAAGLDTSKHAPARLVVALDVSASMRREARLETARKALERLVRRLLPEDRLSIVPFNEKAGTLVDEAGPDDAQQVLAALRGLQPQKSTNIAAGLLAAYELALAQAQTPGRVVLITDGLAELSPEAVRELGRLVGDAARRGVVLDVISLGGDGDPRRHEALLDFAKAGGGRVQHVHGTGGLFAALAEILGGAAPRVAGDVRLKVVFDPKSVLAYRLVGHEARAPAGLKPAPLGIDFYAEQSAGALYEVILAPGGPAEVATAELTWNDPKNGRAERRAVSLRREQLAGRFIEASLALQGAAVAAEAGEILRGAPEVYPLPPYVRLRPTSLAAALAPVLQVARGVDSRLARDPTFAELCRMLEAAGRARPYKAPAGK